MTSKEKAGDMMEPKVQNNPADHTTVPSRVTPAAEERACINGEARYHGTFCRINISNLNQRMGMVAPGSEYDIGLHTHSYYELAYIYDGYPINEINGKSYSCNPGDLFLMNTRVTHRFVGENFYVVSVTLSREDIVAVTEYSMDKRTGKPFKPYTLEKSPVLRFVQYNAVSGKYSALEHTHLLFQQVPAVRDGGFPDWLRGCFDRYAQTLVLMESGWPFELYRILSHIFGAIQDTRYFDCIDITETPDKNRQLYYDVLRLMELTHGNLTRAELAAKLFYSENHIADVVREHCGLTLRQLGRSYLMEEARRLLRDTGGNIEDIANQLGFSGKSSFYHSFKEYFGCTPVQYRSGQMRA